MNFTAVTTDVNEESLSVRHSSSFFITMRTASFSAAEWRFL
jgi:hypothetical protein